MCFSAGSCTGYNIIQSTSLQAPPHPLVPPQCSSISLCPILPSSVPICTPSMYPCTPLATTMSHCTSLCALSVPPCLLWTYTPLCTSMPSVPPTCHSPPLPCTPLSSVPCTPLCHPPYHSAPSMPSTPLCAPLCTPNPCPHIMLALFILCKLSVWISNDLLLLWHTKWCNLLLLFISKPFYFVARCNFDQWKFDQEKCCANCSRPNQFSIVECNSFKLCTI